jgi:hypothetical protein
MPTSASPAARNGEHKPIQGCNLIQKRHTPPAGDPALGPAPPAIAFG